MPSGVCQARPSEVPPLVSLATRAFQSGSNLRSKSDILVVPIDLAGSLQSWVWGNKLFPCAGRLPTAYTDRGDEHRWASGIGAPAARLAIFCRGRLELRNLSVFICVHPIHLCTP